MFFFPGGRGGGWEVVVLVLCMVLFFIFYETGGGPRGNINLAKKKNNQAYLDGGCCYLRPLFVLCVVGRSMSLASGSHGPPKDAQLKHDFG